MKRIIVSGIINIETSLRVESLHLDGQITTYPFFGISSSVSGSGINIVRAIEKLGGVTALASLIGKDTLAGTVYEELHKLKISTKYIAEVLQETPQSIIIYDSMGNSQKHVDLKNIQDHRYPIQEIRMPLRNAGICALGNVNFSRTLIPLVSKKTLIATDVHMIYDIEDDFNKEFMEHANILFLNHDNLPTSAEEFMSELSKRYKAEIIVITMGEQGALLFVRKDNFMQRFHAVRTREVVNTAGAGDALYAAFLYYYNNVKDPYSALQNAILFASYKIGSNLTSDGFLTEKELSVLPYTIIN